MGFDWSAANAAQNLEHKIIFRFVTYKIKEEKVLMSGAALCKARSTV